MARPRLQVKLTGPEDDKGDVLFGDFRDFCGTLALCLRRAEEIVTEKTGLRHRIVGLKHSSACLELEPVPPKKGPDTGADVYGFFTAAVTDLQEGGKADPRLTSEDLRLFRRLAEPMHRRIRKVQIAGTVLTTQYIANIDKLIGISIPSEGSVTGRLERLNVHNRHEFALFPPIGGFTVTCVFPEELYEKVHNGMRKNATVFGTLAFKPDSPFPERVHVKTIEIHPSDEHLPRLADLRGQWKGATGDLTAVEFLKAIRGDKDR